MVAMLVVSSREAISTLRAKVRAASYCSRCSGVPASSMGAFSIYVCSDAKLSANEEAYELTVGNMQKPNRSKRDANKIPMKSVTKCEMFRPNRRSLKRRAKLSADGITPALFRA